MTTTAIARPVKVIGTRELLRNFAQIRSDAYDKGIIFKVESKDEPTIQISATQPAKKKYTKSDWLNWRIKLPKGHKVDKNLSQNIDKYVYGY